jgi:hypothetical protein
VLAVQVRRGCHLDVRVFGHGGKHARAGPSESDHSDSKGWHVQTAHPFSNRGDCMLNAPLEDERPGRWITSHVINQDFVCRVSSSCSRTSRSNHAGVRAANGPLGARYSGTNVPAAQCMGAAFVHWGLAELLLDS